MERKKVLLSLGAGYVSLMLGWFGFLIDRTYDVYFMPGMFIPLLIGMIYGGKYAFLCCIPGLACFQPLLVMRENGFANLVTAVMILIWSVGHGFCMEERRKHNTTFVLNYLYQIAFILAVLLCNRPLMQYLVRYNTYFPGRTYFYLPINIINANTIILLEIMTLWVLVLQLFLALPGIKKLLGQRVKEYDKYSYLILGITVAVVAFSKACSSGYVNELFAVTVTVNDYQSNIGSIEVSLLKTIFVLVLSDISLEFILFYCKKQSYQMEMSKLQEAIFESSDDMIWSIHGSSGKVQTANHSARRFFKEKCESYMEQQFIDIFQGEELDYWWDVIDKVKEEGSCETEYYNQDNRHYYKVSVHYIALGGHQYDMAVFAKDITDEIMLNEQIQEMNDDLENQVLKRTREIQKAYQASEDFGYTVAHELKAPLRAIGLYNQIVLSEEQLTLEAKEAAEKIDGYCVKLVNLVNEILNYTKMKNKKFKFVRIRIDKLIENCVEEFRLINEGQKIQLQQPRLPEVMADEMMLNCCIHNIISNAVKFSSKKEVTQIKVSFEENPEEYIFHIADNGVGFDMEESQKLFQLFGRLHSDTEFEGNGIGLVTVKNIIEKHGGSFFIEAKKQEGCTVTFTLPK